MKTNRKTGNDLYTSIDGVATCYDDYGNGFPVIFIHGFPLDKSTWQPQMEFLSKSNRVIAYDLRGFGKSTPRKEKVSIASFADDLMKFMDILEIDKAIVCGLSMGGYILMDAAIRFPERFEAIVLCDTQTTIDSPGEIEKRKTTIQQIKSNSLFEYAEATINNLFCKKTLETKNELVEKIRYLILSTSPASITKGLNALAKYKEKYLSLNKITIPTLILCGRRDVVTPPAQAEFIHNNIEQSELNFIENAGHLSNLEQPGEFNKYLKDFVSNVEIKIKETFLILNHF